MFRKIIILVMVGFSAGMSLYLEGFGVFLNAVQTVVLTMVVLMLYKEIKEYVESIFQQEKSSRENDCKITETRAPTNTASVVQSEDK
jgi:uncharacterized membrane protein YjjP (DUF1212 family)